MHSIPTPVVKVLSVALAFLIFFAVSSLFSDGILSTPVRSVHDAIRNVAIEGGFQLVDNISIDKVLVPVDTQEPPAESLEQ